MTLAEFTYEPHPPKNPLAIGQVGRPDGQVHSPSPDSLAIRSVAVHVVPLKTSRPMEQLGQKSLAVSRVDGHAKAGDGEPRAETEKRRQAWVLFHCKAMAESALGTGHTERTTMSGGGCTDWTSSPEAECLSKTLCPKSTGVTP